MEYHYMLWCSTSLSLHWAITPWRRALKTLTTLRLVGKHRCIPNQSTLKTKDILGGLKAGKGAVFYIFPYNIEWECAWMQRKQPVTDCSNTIGVQRHILCEHWEISVCICLLHLCAAQRHIATQGWLRWNDHICTFTSITLLDAGDGVGG